MKQRTLAIILGASLSLGSALVSAETERNIHVYKSPTCGCCTDWVKHLEDNGFEVEISEVDNVTPVKIEAGLTPALASCHTAFINDYVIEGHVPADDIKRLLTQAPQARGLSVPGMPAGSPGMEMGDRKDTYQVLLFNANGQTQVFAEHN
ncbi:MULTISPECIES: DUF411 domain-containing protein [unclassified Marinobacter]|jgi:hypothetical protein|uniref:DUF411 domain-containing protein n=1 Tax=unclassified Marinobacter TaxID=83889 RepID=UPI00200C190E|nr:MULTISPECIES: DUF411 domain-containing protein [unclassified Marinobacter]MCL1477738.1 DUF411 domain-containing protein [Marinobacter sp.]MCL1482211.1 DUF411 domain-containing protein [Marinobacter sp.]MCL1485755.1 DUF411 domain-containing protein [Marinobacter sp.]MCL1488992.1 DUF411 domain-containing protein [Marinobacter sp.]UQG55810.1 DUF411 domain-containing protein [Marinobacter sp. M4C]